MSLLDLLSRRRNEILVLWFEEIINTYPPETALFIKKQKNRFANPVGATIREGLEGVYDELVGEAAPERLTPFLENIIRIRAVQDFTPSQAVSFIGGLNTIVRNMIATEGAMGEVLDEFFSFGEKVDQLTFMAFDLFMKSREKIYDLKANEARNMTFRLIERMNRMGEAKPEDPDVRGESA